MSDRRFEYWKTLRDFIVSTGRLGARNTNLNRVFVDLFDELESTRTALIEAKAELNSERAAK